MTLRKSLRLWAREYRRHCLAACGRAHRRVIERQIRGKLPGVRRGILAWGAHPAEIRDSAYLAAGV